MNFDFFLLFLIIITNLIKKQIMKLNITLYFMNNLMVNLRKKLTVIFISLKKCTVLSTRFYSIDNSAS